jgi:hypothetical protein
MNDDYYEFNDDDWNDYIENEHDDDYSEDYLSDEDLLNDIDPIFDIRSPPRLWTKVVVNNETIEVSSEGRVKFKNDLLQSTEGKVQTGTPYKYVKINDKKYYVHELVWCSFNGKVPEGWEVRHKEEYVHVRKRKFYSNHLSNITIYPKNISPVEPSEP